MWRVAGFEPATFTSRLNSILVWGFTFNYKDCPIPYSGYSIRSIPRPCVYQLRHTRHAVSLLLPFWGGEKFWVLVDVADDFNNIIPNAMQKTSFIYRVIKWHKTPTSQPTNPFNTIL